MKKNFIEVELEFEIIENGKVVNIVKGWDEFDAVYDSRKEEIEKSREYKEIEALRGHGKGYTIYFSEVSLSTIVLAWRGRHANVKGKDKKPIYIEGLCENTYGMGCEVNEHAIGGTEQFYITVMDGRTNSRYDVDHKYIAKNLKTKFNTIPFADIKPQF